MSYLLNKILGRIRTRCVSELFFLHEETLKREWYMNSPWCIKNNNFFQVSRQTARQGSRQGQGEATLCCWTQGNYKIFKGRSTGTAVPVLLVSVPRNPLIFLILLYR